MAVIDPKLETQIDPILFDDGTVYLSDHVTTLDELMKCRGMTVERAARKLGISPGLVVMARIWAGGWSEWISGYLYARSKHK